MCVSSLPLKTVTIIYCARGRPFSFKNSDYFFLVSVFFFSYSPQHLLVFATRKPNRTFFYIYFCCCSYFVLSKQLRGRAPRPEIGNILSAMKQDQVAGVEINQKLNKKIALGDVPGALTGKWMGNKFKINNFLGQV